MLVGVLQAGYGVIFLTREGSIQPFTQDLPSAEPIPLLQSLLAVGPGGSPQLQPGAAAVVPVLAAANQAEQQGRLLTLKYTSIFEYIQVMPHGTHNSHMAHNSSHMVDAVLGLPPEHVAAAAAAAATQQQQLPNSSSIRSLCVLVLVRDMVGECMQALCTDAMTSYPDAQLACGFHVQPQFLTHALTCHRSSPPGAHCCAVPEAHCPGQQRAGQPDELLPGSSRV